MAPTILAGRGPVTDASAENATRASGPGADAVGRVRRTGAGQWPQERSRPARRRVSPRSGPWVSNGCTRWPGAATATTGSWPAAGPATGRPILANDPHLQVEFPSVWYEMHLVAAGLDVIGVTIPGVPFVVIGHNARIAWGFTNSGADVQDLALERVDVGTQALHVQRRVAAGRR